MRALAAWALAYVGVGAAAALVGSFTIGPGNAVFVAGALCVLSSIFFVRLGGDRRIVLERDIHGAPRGVGLVPREKRQREVSFGLRLFLLGVALWVPLVVRFFLF